MHDRPRPADFPEPQSGQTLIAGAAGRASIRVTPASPQVESRRRKTMHTLFSRRLALFAAAAALLVATGSLAGAAAGTTRSSPQLKIALIAPSAHNDLAFTQSMYSALKSLQAKYNFKLSVSENEFVVADAANVMRQYASEGYNLIIAHGSQYGGTIQQLAPQFAKVSFAWGTASSTFGLPNVYAYSAASNQGGYVQGYMASLISKTKELGEIGPIATGDAKLYVDGFKAGATAANPEAAVHVSYTGSFSDPSLMSKQASEYLAQKVDVLTGSSQSVVGAITVAKANNVAWFGTQWSQASLAPKQVVSSQVYDWTGTLTKILNGVQAGKLGGSSFAITLKNGGEKIQYNPGYKLAASVKTAAAKVITGIENGSVKAPA
jgi:basic membrane lipoprotein Med (substrate-binding protein (PBP1-ABC) superfamily)